MLKPTIETGNKNLIRCISPLHDIAAWMAPSLCTHHSLTSLHLLIPSDLDSLMEMQTSFKCISSTRTCFIVVSLNYLFVRKSCESRKEDFAHHPIPIKGPSSNFPFTLLFTHFSHFSSRSLLFLNYYDHHQYDDSSKSRVLATFVFLFLKIFTIADAPCLATHQHHCQLCINIRSSSRLELKAGFYIVILRR